MGTPIELKVLVLGIGDRAALVRARGQAEPVEVPLSLVELSAIGRDTYMMTIDPEVAARFGLVNATGVA